MTREEYRPYRFTYDVLSMSDRHLYNVCGALYPCFDFQEERHWSPAKKRQAIQLPKCLDVIDSNIVRSSYSNHFRTHQRVISMKYGLIKIELYDTNALIECEQSCREKILQAFLQNGFCARIVGYNQFIEILRNRDNENNKI